MDKHVPFDVDACCPTTGNPFDEEKISFDDRNNTLFTQRCEDRGFWGWTEILSVQCTHALSDAGGDPFYDKQICFDNIKHHLIHAASYEKSFLSMDRHVPYNEDTYGPTTVNRSDDEKMCFDDINGTSFTLHQKNRTF